MAANLFDEEEPVGKTIRVRNLVFKVLGTLAPKGQSVTGQDQDDFILMPYTTAQRKVKGVTWLDDIMCSAVSAESIPSIEDDLTDLMRQRHHLFPGQGDDFNIRLRMAVGARERDIRLQFLAEAVVLCLTGCLLGVAAGLMTSRWLADTLGWPLLVSPWAVAAASSSAVFIGLVFGYDPAWNASRQDPIEALRYE